MQRPLLAHVTEGSGEDPLNDIGIRDHVAGYGDVVWQMAKHFDLAKAFIGLHIVRTGIVMATCPSCAGQRGGGRPIRHFGHRDLPKNCLGGFVYYEE